jgi:hypothetical protein
MIRVHAGPIVAVMAHLKTIWHWTAVDLPGDDVRSDAPLAAATGSHVSVPV